MSTMAHCMSWFLGVDSLFSRKTSWCVLQDHVLSDPAGVPQESVISPSLFSVLVNDPEDAIPQYWRVQVC